MQAAASASAPNSAQRSATPTRCAGGACHSASSATGASSARPKVKLPCRLAHSAISGSSAKDGGRRVIERAHQPGHPGHHQRQRQRMRPRHHMRRRQHESRRREHKRRRQRQALEQEARQQAEGNGDGGGGQHDDAGPAGESIGAGECHLRQPLAGDPVRPGHGEGEGVDLRYRVVRDDPAAERDLPIGVGVVEQAGAEQQQQQIDRGRHGQRPGERQPPTLRGRFGVRIGHTTVPGAAGGPPPGQ